MILRSCSRMECHAYPFRYCSNPENVRGQPTKFLHSIVSKAFLFMAQQRRNAQLAQYPPDDDTMEEEGALDRAPALTQLSLPSRTETEARRRPKLKPKPKLLPTLLTRTVTVVCEELYVYEKLSQGDTGRVDPQRLLMP